MTRDPAELIASAGKTFVQNYKQQPIVLTRGDGVWVWDVKGDRYLDMNAGIAVSALGHAHPRLVGAIAAQAGRILHTSNLVWNDVQIRLAEELTRRSFADRVFFANSGAEANEAALKLARRYQQVVARAPERVTLVSTEGSFHGRTFATVSLTGQEKYRKNFGPMLEPVRYVPYGDLGALEAALGDGRACAFLLEPIQAEGGLIVPPPGYLAAVRDLCSRTGTVLIFDEVQTGVGRTGTLFAYEQEGCTPDVMTLAKGLAGGVPIGALLATDEAAKGLAPLPGEPPPHASTFGGNPLACAAALAVLETIDAEGLLARVTEVGEHLGRGLARLVERYPALATEVRGRGLLRGVVVKDVAQVNARCREKGLLLSVAGAATLRFAPPLVVTTAEIDAALAILDAVLAERATA